MLRSQQRRKEFGSTLKWDLRHLQAVLDALRANGVEVLEDGLRLVPKKGKR